MKISAALRPIATMIAVSSSMMLFAGHPAQAAPARTVACEALTRLKLANTTVTGATVIDDSGRAVFAPSGAAALPAFCRVTAQVRAAPDSDIGVEVWLPLKGWSGVFHGNGNGGFAGVLTSGYPGMAAGLRRGYATATTDMGAAPATPLDGDALIGHPRKWKDWGRLSTHEMTVAGKAIAQAFYGRGASRAYYTGCSTGGQQGLIEALYYPGDYDGILVGAPVINRTWGHAAVLWDFAAAHRTPASLLSDEKLRVLNAAAIASCVRQGRALPGDPFVSDPFGCAFDPQEIACPDAAAPACLTPEEVATARAFYAGPTSRDGRPAFFGWLPGSEAPSRFGWSFLESASNGEPQFGSLFKWVFGADWTWRSFDLDRDMPIVDAALGPDVNDAARGSLQAFAARGGKLIVYHGLADTLVPPGQTVAFFERQAQAMGGPARLGQGARLFLAPGMTHCAGGAGPDSFNSAIGGAAPPAGSGPGEDLFQALTRWTDGGPAPERVVATKFIEGTREVALQRPICAFPRKAVYRGRGPRQSAASFACVRSGTP
ncbi:MAG: tannase/feruloyl esterase family alpha/beta hydrolase [Phenylobacterium sp.]|uniref:tannase/feruloyl esterase family alpha/beta hydrolase n=1 Tax=Phenylobacterium sp. TaxID=1871053 RepID=UPI0025D17647|nr:tannase/feruloyl esterase family alpha/beta hydrolase [Phenylobacterium sp.]MBI1199283.1 tannase/feruloyl esterase family alpha/beta hydrolase [Phenylobacterium sp.]